MAKGKRRGHGGEHENHERWLLTYADMITLLVAFFIMLYAMSVMNVTKFQQLAVSVRSGFGGSVTNGTPTIMQAGGGVEGNPAIVTNSDAKNDNDRNNQKSPKETTEEAKVKAQQFLPIDVPSAKLGSGEEDKRFADVATQLQKYVDAHQLGGKVQIVINERGIVIRLLTDKMLFESGKAELRTQEAGLLDTISLMIQRGVDNPIEVEGHTDNLPIHTSQFPSNWELSTSRATTVLRFLGDHGVPWKQLRAAGYADQRPIALNDTEDGRRRNRRVDIVILRKFAVDSTNPSA